MSAPRHSTGPQRTPEGREPERTKEKRGSAKERGGASRYGRKACPSPAAPPFMRLFYLFCPKRKSTTPGAQRREAQKEPTRESASHARPKEGDKCITAETPGSKRPKARLFFLLDTRGRPRPPLQSPHGGPICGFKAGQHTTAPRPLVDKRGVFARWPLFFPNPRKHVEASDPRELVARPPIGAGQCRPPGLRKSSPSKQCEIQAKKIRADNRHQQRPRYPSARRPIRWQSPRHDPSAGRGQRRAHESRPATITADLPALYTTARAGPPQETQMPQFLLFPRGRGRLTDRACCIVCQGFTASIYVSHNLRASSLYRTVFWMCSTMAVSCAWPRVFVGPGILPTTGCVNILARSYSAMLTSVGQVMEVSVNRKVSNAVPEYLRKIALPGGHVRLGTATNTERAINMRFKHASRRAHVPQIQPGYAIM